MPILTMLSMLYRFSRWLLQGCMLLFALYLLLGAGGAKAADDFLDPVVAHAQPDLAANAAIGADGRNFLGRRRGPMTGRVHHGLRQQGAGRAGLHALPASHAGGGAHRIVEIEYDLFQMTAARHADHVVDLHLATGAHAEAALDAVGLPKAEARRVVVATGEGRGGAGGNAPLAEGAGLAVQVQAAEGGVAG